MRSRLAAFAAQIRAWLGRGLGAVRGRIGAVRRVPAPVVAAFATFVVAWAGLGTLEAKESEEARVRARVREYTTASAAPLRRDLIVRELGAADGALTARVVREAALSDARRAAALDLAARLRLAGVWEIAKRWADGPCEAEALALAASAPEPEASAWLVARWAAAEPSGERARRALEAMTTRRLPIAAVEAIGPSLGDPSRAEDALRVLRTQMAVDDSCPADLRARWDEALAVHRAEALEHPRDGEDLLAAPGWRLGSARPVGRNLRIAGGGWIDLAALPFPAQAGPGTLRVRVRTGAGGGAFVSLATAGGAEDLRLQGDGRTWALVEGPPRAGARVEAPQRPGAWQTIEVRISDPGIPARPATRDLRVFVDGAELRPSGGFWRLTSPPMSLSIGGTLGATRDAAGEGTSGGSGTDLPTVVGGVTWARAAP